MPDRQNRDRWLRAVLDRYEGPLVRYAARFVGNLERARDVVQDAFMRLASQDKAEVDGHVGPWLYTVCRRRAIEIRRKENRVQAFTEVIAESQVSPLPGPERMAEDRQSFEHLSELLTTLPENQQEVVRLRFQEGLRYKEIAEVTGLSIGNVGLLLHNALQTIRSHFNITPKPAAANGEHRRPADEQRRLS